MNEEMLSLINNQSDRGNTLLHLALNSNDFTFIGALLGNGSNRLIANNDGELPIHLAAKSTYIPEKIFTLLLSTDLKQQLSAKNNDNKTALDSALELGRTEIICYLLLMQHEHLNQFEYLESSIQKCKKVNPDAYQTAIDAINILKGNYLSTAELASQLTITAEELESTKTSLLLNAIGREDFIRACQLIKCGANPATLVSYQPDTLPFPEGHTPKPGPDPFYRFSMTVHGYRFKASLVVGDQETSIEYYNLSHTPYEITIGYVYEQDKNQITIKCLAPDNYPVGHNNVTDSPIMLTDLQESLPYKKGDQIFVKSINNYAYQQPLLDLFHGYEKIQSKANKITTFKPDLVLIAEFPEEQRSEILQQLTAKYQSNNLMLLTNSNKAYFIKDGKLLPELLIDVDRVGFPKTLKKTKEQSVVKHEDCENWQFLKYSNPETMSLVNQNIEKAGLFSVYVPASTTLSKSRMFILEHILKFFPEVKAKIVMDMNGTSDIYKIIKDQNLQSSSTPAKKRLSL